MYETILGAELPWSISREEDRRFRWILFQTLAVSLVIGVITPYIPIPQPALDIEQELPPRRVRLLAPLPTSRPVPAASTADTVVPPKARSVPAKSPASGSPAPRQAVSRRGVLAMGDALTELRDLAPREDAGVEGIITDSVTDRAAPRSSTLTADVTRGSGGIAGGVAHRLVLGTAELPHRGAVTSGSGGPEKGAQAPGGSAAAPGTLRSQEAIQEVLDRNKGAMFTLYNRALREEPGLQGKLVLSITIAPAGTVTRCVVISSELASGSLERQLVALVSAIDFGKLPEASVVTTKIPIEFFPR